MLFARLEPTRTTYAPLTIDYARETRATLAWSIEQTLHSPIHPRSRPALGVRRRSNHPASVLQFACFRAGTAFAPCRTDSAKHTQRIQLDSEWRNAGGTTDIGRAGSRPTRAGVRCRAHRRKNPTRPGEGCRRCRRGLQAPSDTHGRADAVTSNRGRAGALTPRACLRGVLPSDVSHVAGQRARPGQPPRRPLGTMGCSS
jgi:hypothetical protein